VIDGRRAGRNCATAVAAEIGIAEVIREDENEIWSIILSIHQTIVLV
jgi:hypothetical protein